MKLLLFISYLQAAYLQTEYTSQQLTAQAEIFETANSISVIIPKKTQEQKSSFLNFFKTQATSKETSQEKTEPTTEINFTDTKELTSITNPITNPYNSLYTEFCILTDNLPNHKTFMERWKSFLNENDLVNRYAKLLHYICDDKYDKIKTENFILLLLQYANQKLDKKIEHTIATAACNLLGIKVEKNVLDKLIPDISLYNFLKYSTQLTNEQKFIALLGLSPNAFCALKKNKRDFSICCISKTIWNIILKIFTFIKLLVITGIVIGILVLVVDAKKPILEILGDIKKIVRNAVNIEQEMLPIFRGNATAVKQFENSFLNQNQEEKLNSAIANMLGVFSGNKTDSENILDKVLPRSIATFVTQTNFKTLLTQVTSAIIIFIKHEILDAKTDILNEVNLRVNEAKNLFRTEAMNIRNEVRTLIVKANSTYLSLKTDIINEIRRFEGKANNTYLELKTDIINEIRNLKADVLNTSVTLEKKVEAEAVVFETKVEAEAATLETSAKAEIAKVITIEQVEESAIAKFTNNANNILRNLTNSAIAYAQEFSQFSNFIFGQ